MSVPKVVLWQWLGSYFAVALLSALVIVLVAPTLVVGSAELQFSGSTYASAYTHIALRDSLVVCATSSGIEVLVLRDTLTPTPISQLRFYDQRGMHYTDYGVAGLEVYGQYAYVADVNGHLYCIDMVDPVYPSVVEDVRLSKPLTAIDIAGGIGCVAYGSYLDSIGLILLDMSNPSEIRAAGSLRFPDSLNPASDVAIRDTILFVVWQGALLSYSIADPAIPVFLDSVGVAANSRPFVNLVFAPHDSLIYLLDRGHIMPACQSALTVVNAGNPADLQALSSYFMNGAALGLAVTDRFVLHTAGTWGLQVYDRSNPILLDSLTRFPVNYFGGGIDANESLAVVVDLGAEYFFNADIENPSCHDFVDQWSVPYPPVHLMVIDLTQPLPRVKCTYTLPSPTTSLATAANGFVYAMCSKIWYDDIKSISVSNPTHPLQVGSFLTGFGNTCGTVVDTMLYVASSGAGTIYTPGIRSINIADPANPCMIAEETLAVGGINMHLRDTYLYVLRGTAGLSFVNIADPAKPTTVYTFDTPGGAQDACWLDSTIYIADGNYGVIVVCMPELGRVLWVGQCGGLNQGYYRVAIRDSLLLAFTPNSLQTFSLSSDPIYPPQVSTASLDSIQDLQDIWFDDSLAYVADGRAGVLVYDIRNPAYPQLIAQYDTPVNALAIDVVGSMVYVADNESIVVLQLLGPNNVGGSGGSLPTGFGLRQNYPNPFNPATTIEYHVSRRAHVNIDLFNIQGKKVRNLVSQKQSAGQHKVELNSDGLASGVYFYRMTVDGIAQGTKKMVLLK